MTIEIERGLLALIYECLCIVKIGKHVTFQKKNIQKHNQTDVVKLGNWGLGIYEDWESLDSVWNKDTHWCLNHPP